MIRVAARRVAHAFRGAAVPLTFYYVVALALPLANGAAHAGAAFVEHAVAVLLVPPIVVVLLTSCRRWPPGQPRRCFQDQARDWFVVGTNRRGR